MDQVPVDAWHEWRARYDLEPWGEERLEILLGHLSSLMDACHRTKGEVRGPLEYMPILRPEKESQSEPEMQQVWGLITAQLKKKNANCKMKNANCKLNNAATAASPIGDV